MTCLSVACYLQNRLTLFCVCIVAVGVRVPPRCPLMAQSRHAQCADDCPLLGARRTLANRSYQFRFMSIPPSLKSSTAIGPMLCTPSTSGLRRSTKAANQGALREILREDRLTGYGCEWLCDEQRKALIAWAEATGEWRVRVFGSRAKGTARSDSDLDLAITTSFGCFASLADKWAEHLASSCASRRKDQPVLRRAERQRSHYHRLLPGGQRATVLSASWRLASLAQAMAPSAASRFRQPQRQGCGRVKCPRR